MCPPAGGSSPGLQDLQWKAEAQAADRPVQAISVFNRGRRHTGGHLIDPLHQDVLKHTIGHTCLAKVDPVKQF